ncbi:MAG: hypothetical protein VYC39_09295 [Myxococcota bacterium]|nr:hypothetical protein [Myxococcota bacterium]
MRNSTAKLSFSLAFCGSLFLGTAVQASVSQEDESSSKQSVTSISKNEQKKDDSAKSKQAQQPTEKTKNSTKSTTQVFVTSLVNSLNQKNSVATNMQSPSVTKSKQNAQTFVATTPAPTAAPNPSPTTPSAPVEKVETYTIEGTLMEISSGEIILRVQSKPKASTKPSLNQLISAVHAYQLVRIENLSTQKLSSETMITLAERVFENIQVTYQVKGDSAKFAIDVR